MAGNTVAGELYYELDGQLLEIKRQLRQPSGYPFDAMKLRRYLQDLIEGRFGDDIVPKFCRNTPKERWTMYPRDMYEGDLPEHPKLEIVPILREGELRITPVELLRRADDVGANLHTRNAGQLQETNEIPLEWRGEYILVFAGAVWLDSGDGKLYVATLHWHGEEGHVSFFCLDDDWHFLGRFVRLAS